MQSQILRLDSNHQSNYANGSPEKRYPPIPAWETQDSAFSEITKLKELYLKNFRPAATFLTPTQVQPQTPTPFIFLLSFGLTFLGLNLDTANLFQNTSSSSPQQANPKSKTSLLTHPVSVLSSQNLQAHGSPILDPSHMRWGMLYAPDSNINTPMAESAAPSLQQVQQVVLNELKKRLAKAEAKTVQPKSKLAFSQHKVKFIQPVVGFPITSPFGDRIHPIFGSRIPHTGIDVGTPTGTPIRAAEGGRVIFAGWDGGYGNVVIISHNNGYETLYAHLESLHVTVDDPVTQGEVIGLSGSTGYVTGPHLHFEIRFNDVAYNPMDYL